MATNEIVAELAVKEKNDPFAKLKKFSDKISGIATSAKKLGFVMTGVKGAIDYFTGTVMKESKELELLSNRTGISVEGLQRWTFAAKSAGIASESLLGDISNMKNNLFMSDKDIAGWADKLAKMDRINAYRVGNMLNISKETVDFFRSGGMKYLKDADKLGVVIPEKQIKQAAEFNKNLNQTLSLVKSVKDQLFLALAPELNKTISKFQEWVVTNRELINQKLEVVVGGISKGFSNFGESLAGMGKGVMDFLSNTGLIDDKLKETEKVAKATEWALWGIGGTMVLSGLAKLLTSLQAIVNVLKTPVFKFLAELAAAFGIGYGATSAATQTIAEGGTEGMKKELADKGGAGILDYFKVMAIGYGEIGENIYDFFHEINQHKIGIKTRDEVFGNKGNVTVNNYLQTGGSAQEISYALEKTFPNANNYMTPIPVTQ